MNRFGTYLNSKRLAKMLLVQAEYEWASHRDHDALRDAIKAMETFFTATNCLASLAWEKAERAR